MRSLRSPARPAVYYPIAHQYEAFMALHLVPEPGEALPDALVRQTVAGVDPELPVPRVVRLDEAIEASMSESRTIGYLVGTFAVLALVLAAVGLELDQLVAVGPRRAGGHQRQGVVQHQLVLLEDAEAEPDDRRVVPVGLRSRPASARSDARTRTGCRPQTAESPPGAPSCCRGLRDRPCNPPTSSRGPRQPSTVRRGQTG